MGLGRWNLPLPLVLVIGAAVVLLSVRQAARQSEKEQIADAEVEELSLRDGPSPRAPVDLGLLLLDPLELASIPRADRWEHPLGSAQGAFAYNAQPFLTTRHLGDDLNGIGGWNSDLGDPVFAAARGRVLFAGEASGGWGKMVILGHRLPSKESGDRGQIIQSVYAHMEVISVGVGDLAHRGMRIGTVGTASGRYLAHLHFEIRQTRSPEPGVGYADEPLARVAPERWIRSNRLEGDLLVPAPEAIPSLRPSMEMNLLKREE